MKGQDDSRQLYHLTDNGSCGSDWVTYEGSCFYFSTVEKIYADSVSHCGSLDASPAIISSLEEIEFVSLTRSDTWDNRYWIQGNDKTIGEQRLINNFLVMPGKLSFHLTNSPLSRLVMPIVAVTLIIKKII